MMSCQHAKVIVLASWGSGSAVRSLGQSLRVGPGIGAHRSSENPEDSNSKNGLYWESRTITLVIVWKIYHGAKKDLMFFFNTSVPCIINRTLRKHNTNEVKDSVIFFTNHYFMVIPLLIRVTRLLSEMMYKTVEKRLQYIVCNLL